MTIERGDGNLITADVDAIVNTVNTEGVMGKGLALQVKSEVRGAAGVGQVARDANRPTMSDLSRQTPGCGYSVADMSTFVVLWVSGTKHSIFRSQTLCSLVMTWLEVPSRSMAARSDHGSTHVPRGHRVPARSRRGPRDLAAAT